MFFTGYIDFQKFCILFEKLDLINCSTKYDQLDLKAVKNFGQLIKDYAN